MTSRILLLFTGGTIAMVKDQKGTLVPAKTPEQVLSLAPELATDYSIQVENIDNVDSTNIQTWHWEKLAQAISQKYTDYDGFVITHGTDTMSYSASALSFALQNLGKPIVFTGALLPPDHINSDARKNLVHAVQVAAADMAEVAIVYGSEILRGNRSLKLSKMDFNPYWSPVFPILGNIIETATISEVAKKRTHVDQPKIQTTFDDQIVVFTVTPGFSPDWLDMVIEKGIHGIVLGGFGVGNIPNKYKSLVPGIKKATQRGIPVVITSQCLGGFARSVMYEVGLTALEAGAISARDMTLEAASTKLMWLLGQTKDVETIRVKMGKNLAGELTE